MVPASLSKTLLILSPHHIQPPLCTSAFPLDEHSFQWGNKLAVHIKATDLYRYGPVEVASVTGTLPEGFYFPPAYQQQIEFGSYANPLDYGTITYSADNRSFTYTRNLPVQPITGDLRIGNINFWPDSIFVSYNNEDPAVAIRLGQLIL